MFGLLKVRFEVPMANVHQDAWIYIAYVTVHRTNP